MSVDKIIEIAKIAGEIVLNADRSKKYDTKEGRANFVTEYDRRVQNFLVDELKKYLPNALFVCEENDLNQGYNDHDYRFVIDPIDGTTNFIHGALEYAICIGLMKGDIQVCGVVYCPALDLTYFAEHGKGAFVNKGDNVRKIHVSSSALDGAIVGAGTAPYNFDHVVLSLDIAKHILTRAADTRRSGSAAIDICRAAEGVYDIMFEYRNYAWDYTAASIILCEAGGKFSNFKGESIVGDIPSSVVAGAPVAVDEFIEYIKSLDLGQENGQG